MLLALSVYQILQHLFLFLHGAADKPQVFNFSGASPVKVST